MEEVYFEDLSHWHHLIFCEELANDDRDLCSGCFDSVVGDPVYKCLECDFRLQKSCFDQKLYVRSKGEREHSNIIALRETDMIDNVRAHDYLGTKYHHLTLIEDTLIEDVEDSGNEGVFVCAAGCGEPVFGRPTYECTICNFFLHKWCTDLPHLIQHPMHPEHPLFLQDKITFVRSELLTLYCDACGKKCKESLFYRCSLCNFKVDVKCANNSRWRINADDYHEHEFVPTTTQIQFTCQACGEEFKRIAFICSICRLMIHGECTPFLPTIKTLTHEHPLTRTYSLRQVEKQQDKAFCKLCGRDVNIEYGAYYCQTCDHHIAHLNCAYKFIDVDFFYSRKKNELMASNSDDYRTHVVHLVEGIKPVEDPREIKHSLSDKKLKVDHKRCDACMQFIIFDASFYSYAQFNFLLHNRCTKIPHTITRMLFHEHPLTLISKYLGTNGLFWCDICSRPRNGFAYSCDKCNYNCDVQCCLIPDILDHEGHTHPLYMSILSSDEACNACGENVRGLVEFGENVKNIVKFNCNDCCNKFTLCIRCATLPLVARYEHDAHLVQLAYTCEYDPKEYYCLICEEERHPNYWFYYCEECKFTAHPRCVIGKNPGIDYGRTWKDKLHWHPLTIIEKTKHSPPCDRCGKPFDDGMALRCTQCEFNVHFQKFSWGSCLKKY